MTIAEQPTMNSGKYEELRWITDVYMQEQKMRIAIGNRLFAAKKGLDSNYPDSFAQQLFDQKKATEEAIFKQMEIVVRDHPAWPWLKQVKGIGPTLSTKVLGLIGDIENFDNVAKLWSFSGYGLKERGQVYAYDGTHEVNDIVRPVNLNGHAYKILEFIPEDDLASIIDDLYEIGDGFAFISAPEEVEWPDTALLEFYVIHEIGAVRVKEDGPDHERQRAIKGEKLSFNRRLKTALYLCAESFVRSRSPYRRLYDNKKQYYRIHKQLKPMRRVLGPFEEPDRGTEEGLKEWKVLIGKANKQAGVDKDQAAWTDGHVDNAAKRYMTKIFLSNLWQIWRKAEGLPVRPTYPEEYLDHTTRFEPEEFIAA